MEGMEDQRYSRFDGRDGRLEILKVRWEGWKIRDTQGQVEMMNNQEYSHLVEMIKDQKYSRLGGMDERVKIPTVRWKG